VKKRMRTVRGETATRRVKWFQPTYGMHNGEKYVDIFVYFEITFGPEPYKLLYVGAQLGLDMKGRAVLPGSQVFEAAPEYIAAFNFAVPANRILETVENFGSELNRRIEEEKKHWWTPAGVTRGNIMRGKLQNEAAYNLGINPVHVA